MTKPVISRSKLLDSFGKSYVTASVLTEARKASWADLRVDGRFDVFLSHSHIDKELIIAFSKMLQSAGLKVYIDWIIDKNRDGEPVTVKNALRIRERMKQCNSMVYLHTPNAKDSRWCPWEIGYFDAYKSEVSVALIAETERSTTGQEYLDLYPRFKTTNYASPNRYSFKKLLTASSDEKYVF